MRCLLQAENVGAGGWPIHVHRVLHACRFDGYPNQHPGVQCGNQTPNYNMRSVRAVRRAASPNASLVNFSVDLQLNTTVPLAFDKLDAQCVDVYNTAVRTPPAHTPAQSRLASVMPARTHARMHAPIFQNFARMTPSQPTPAQCHYCAHSVRTCAGGCTALAPTLVYLSTHSPGWCRRARGGGRPCRPSGLTSGSRRSSSTTAGP